MYTSSENYPEEKPAQDSSLALVAEYIGIAGLVAGDFDPAAAIGNCIEAETVGGKTQAAATLTQQLYQQVYKNTTRKAEIFARNIQALNVLGGVFFADLNRVWAQAEEFINRPPMEQMIESAAEASWRRRLEGYVLSDRIAISGISEGIKLCITPKIYTKLPVDDESGQAGYVSATRGEYTIDAPNSGQNIGLDGVMGFNAPILVKTVSNAEVSAVEASMSSSEASQEHRKTALD
ncbi:MAG TPA: hypothetical protein VFB59_05860, partial [Candidatus Saccharimonadales bacterium]|nr:hypothetical protein [Candidatus Saccharimonadales bacterium]